MKFFDQAYEMYKDLPPIAKGIVIIGGGAIAWFGVLNPLRQVIIKKLDESKYKKSVNEFRSDLNSLKQKGITPNFSDAQYKSWADTIESKFSGCDWSEPIFKVNVPIVGAWSGSGAALYNILLNFKNDADFSKLVIAFDTRTYDQCGTWPFSGNITANLYKAVEDELDVEEITEINKLLQKQKISYRF